MRRRALVTPIAAATGLAVDHLLGEPPTRLHPVVGFGRAMSAAEGLLYADRRANGIVYATTGVAVGAAAGRVLQHIVGRGPATVAATALAVGGRMLDTEANAIAARLELGDLDGARLALRALVGRRTEQLNEAEVVRAVIESVAENTVDAVTAALFYGGLGGPIAVSAYRAINTMDAMVGHRDARYTRFGWAAARLDDLVNLVPARLTAALVLAPMLARRTHDGAGVLRGVLTDARQHPSPNGGLVEAAFAYRLGVVLGGVNRYGEVVQNRGRVGRGRTPVAADIARAVRLRRQSSAAAAVAQLCMAMAPWAWAAARLRPWSARRRRTGSGR